MENDNRLERGYSNYKEVIGDLGTELEAGLKEVFPDLYKYFIAHVWGDIYSRTELDPKSKEMAVVAALTAMGNAMPQLKLHLKGALNVGCTINELKEIILQMSAFAGFPACINAMNTLKAVLEERKNDGIVDESGAEPTNSILPHERYEAGKKVFEELDARQIGLLEKVYNDFSPDLVKLIICGQADITARNNLNKRNRELAAISALTALGTAQSQLKTHINMGLNIGLKPEEIKETMLLLTAFLGFPAAINGINTLKAVLEERNA